VFDKLTYKSYFIISLHNITIHVITWAKPSFQVSPCMWRFTITKGEDYNNGIAPKHFPILVVIRED